MKIRPFVMGNAVRFLSLAHKEGWVVDEWELSFLLSRHGSGCFSAEEHEGGCAGFVTSILHGRSGWIGNLIVEGESRGRGFGRRLFLEALGYLRGKGAETVWLTASGEGAPIYSKQGFRQVDGVTRWAGTGRDGIRAGQYAPAAGLTDDAMALDRHAWGDERHELLQQTAERGVALSGMNGFLVIQPCGGDLQFGPWSAGAPEEAACLFDKALKFAGSGRTVFVDTPSSNRHASRMLKRRGFRELGRTLLMYAGRRPDWRPGMIYGLATLGSCG